MAYTAEKPPIAEPSDVLRARIPGWGVDLDPSVRPSVPRLQFDVGHTGAHWEMPDRQKENWPRERSIEHAFLTPVFGTSCPLHGVSGRMRRFSYDRFSEGRAAHWLILIAADRVDAFGAHLKSLLSLHPDNPITQTGVLSELRYHGVTSRTRKKRADVLLQAFDPVIIAAPWLAAGGVVYGLARRRAARMRTKRGQMKRGSALATHPVAVGIEAMGIGW